MSDIYNQAKEIMSEVYEGLDSKMGNLLVIGCSTSTVLGDMPGTNSSEEIADDLYKAVTEVFGGKYDIAVQCCEHLNRAVVLDREAAIHYGFDIVNVVPQIHAGGAFAVKHFKNLENPVVVEDIKQKALVGIDIGGVMIGMHIRPVVVPLHLENKQIGMARVSAGRHRPKYIGGQRAVYDPNLM